MRTLYLLFSCCLCIAADPGAVRAIDLQPHRAIYRMVLGSAARNSDVVSANGLMIYRFARGCDGWTVENRTFLRLLYQNDTEADTLWSFASWESMDGRRFRFHARYDQNGRNVEALDGEAELDRSGGLGLARYEQPPKTVIALPPGTVFPTEHVRQILAEAERGRNRLSRVVFDGASLDNPYVVNALFGRLPAEASEALANQHKLPPKPAWWTRMAFFPADDREGRAEFEMGAHYRADGIADLITQHFETFSLDVRLKQIELLPPPDC